MSSLSQEDHLLLLRKQTILYAELVQMERDFEKKRQEKIAEMIPEDVDDKSIEVDKKELYEIIELDQ